MSFYRVETGSAGYRACPLGLVLVSGVGSEGPWLAKFCIRDSGFPIILRVVKGKGGAGVFCLRRPTNYHSAVALLKNPAGLLRLTIILPATNVVLYIATLALDWRSRSPYASRALFAIDFPWSGLMVSYNRHVTLAVVAFLGTAWWYFIARIGWDSKKQKLSRLKSALGAILLFFVFVGGVQICVEDFVKDLRTVPARPFLILYVPAAMLCIGALVSLLYALAGAFQKRTSPGAQAQ